MVNLGLSIQGASSDALHPIPVGDDRWTDESEPMPRTANEIVQQPVGGLGEMAQIAGQVSRAGHALGLGPLSPAERPRRNRIREQHASRTRREAVLGHGFDRLWLQKT